MEALIRTIVNEVKEVLGKVNEAEALRVSGELNNAKRIFVCGEGRSGLMAKASAMRLMHGGYSIFVVGETITPSIEEDDLLVVFSGSGSTDSIFQLAKKAKGVNANVILFTTNKESKIADVSDFTVLIPAATKNRRVGEPETIQPLSNQFDQSIHLLFDAIIIHSLRSKGETNDEMKRRHANLE